ncbi:sigma 54-interacting transcriptional regulator [Lachnospiraceae bacterium 62-35]
MNEESKKSEIIRIVFIIPYPQLEKSIKHMVRSYLSQNREKSISLLYIVPWDEQEAFLLNKGDNTQIPQEDEDTRYLSVNTRKPIDQFISAYLEKVNFEYNAVIARGNLCDKMREGMAVPVVDIPFTGYDVIYALMECQKRYQPSRIAVVGRHHVVCHARGLGKIVGCELNIYDAGESFAVEKQIRKALQEGCDAVIGGYTTVICAKSHGLNAIVIKTGAEAVRMALEESIHMVEALRKEREISETYRIIAQAAKDGMVYVNSKKTVNVINQAAAQMYVGKERNLAGLPLEKVFPQTVNKVEAVLKSGREISNELHNYGDMTLLASYLPVMVGEKTAGVVLHLQNVSKIQDTESQVRKKLSHRGLNAKYHLEDVVHKSRIMEETLKIARRYAEVSSNILIVGETGTGKELIAQGIHNLSSRRDEPFIAVNCAALAESLLESELFGYVGGAFTGASKGGKMGLFELAHKGTIFLDEISEIPLNFQSKLLRVLQEQEIRRIGDDKVIPINVRVIAATNRNLQRMVQEGQFRKDLLYRLNILRLYVPPLRSRKEDIGLLFETFLKEYISSFHREPVTLTEEGLEELTDYDFSGNVRELRNLAERVSVLHSGETLGKKEIAGLVFPEDIEENINAGLLKAQAEDNTSEQAFFLQIFEEFQRRREEIQKGILEQAGRDIYDTKGQVEKALIEKTLKECGSNQGKAAKALGIDRSTLWRKMKRYGLLK